MGGGGRLVQQLGSKPEFHGNLIIFSPAPPGTHPPVTWAPGTSRSSCAAAACAASRLRDVSTTASPARRNSRHSALPMPLLPPVTTKRSFSGDFHRRRCSMRCSAAYRPPNRPPTAAGRPRGGRAAPPAATCTAAASSHADDTVRPMGPCAAWLRLLIGVLLPVWDVGGLGTLPVAADGSSGSR